MTDGMSAQARATQRLREEEIRLGQAEQQRVRIKASEDRSIRSARRSDAAGTIVAGAGVIAAHKGRQIGIEAIDKAASFDYAKRYQVVAGGVSEEAQRIRLLPQALRIGQETKFTNEDIVEAQTATLQGLPMKGDAKAAVAAAIVENVKNYAVMMRAPMESSAQGIRAFLQTSQKDISTEEKAVFEAKRASNLLVKMAKLGGMKDNDVQDFITYGVPTGTSSGLSDTTLAALGAAGKRSGLGGSETGVFVRAAASKLVAPTSKGLDALTAAGIDYNKFTKMPDAGLNVTNLESFSKRRFGKDFSEDQRARLRDLLEDAEVVSNKDEFTKQVSEIVSEGFGKTKNGKTKAQDSQKIAKMAGDFHKLSTENVNSEALLDEILSNPKMTIALRNAFFTDKHGGKASVLSSQFDQFGKDREELKHLQDQDPEFAARSAKYMADGLGGSIDNLKGSWETLVLNIGTANEGLIRFAAEGLAKGTDLFSSLSGTQKQVVSLFGGGAAVAGGVYGTAKLAGKLLGFGGGAALTGSATALTASSVALDASAAALTRAAILQGGKGVVPEVVKNAAPAAPVAAAAFGLGGVTVAAGALAGAYLDSSETTQGGMGVAAVTGQETTGQRLIRENREMLERQKTLAGKREELSQRLDTERGVAERLGKTYEGQKNTGVEATQAAAADRIAKWEAEIQALDAKIKALGDMPAPPARPAELADNRVKPLDSADVLDPNALKPVPLLRPHPKMLDAEAAEREAAEAGQKAGDAFGKAIVNTPLPPPVPEIFGPMKRSAGEAGTEAGTKVGEGIRSGIETKAPEVEEQGRTLFDRLKNLFSEGIKIPISFASADGSGGGEGGGLIQKASFGGGGSSGLGGLVRRTSLGAGSNGDLNGGSGDGSYGTGFVPRSGGGGISARDMRGIHPEFAAHIRASALSQGIDPDIAMRIANSEGLRGSTPNRLTPGDYENGKPTSFGPFQLHYGRSGGLGNRYTKETGHHAGDPQHWREQIDFALRTARKEGWGAWYGRKGAGIGLRDGIGTVKPVPMPKNADRPKVPADEPRLVKGLDGKEGLDLGDGTMKMPDGSIRSIARGTGLTIPEPPVGGFGSPAGGRGDMRAAAERMHQAADRMEGMGFHGQIQLAVTGSGRDSVRATGMRTRGRGGMSADMGVSMPGAKESDSDWI